MEKTVSTQEFRIFSELLRATRRRAGITQVELAAAVGQTQSYVSKVERGECRLDIVQLRAYCAALNTTLLDFIAEFEKQITASKGSRRRRRKGR